MTNHIVVLMHVIYCVAACKFEYKWKNVSRKTSRKKKPEEEGGLHLLQHRNAALEKVKGSIDCSDLEFDWKLELS